MIFGLLPLVILTGLALSPGMNAAWPWLLDLFGGRQSARTWHFMLAAALVLFTLGHVLLALLSLALGVLYIGIAGLCLIELRHDNEAGRDNILFLLSAVWASDIGAYMAGRVFGGPRLWPQVSPNKTWSGSIGGLVFAMLVGALLTLVLAPGSMARAAAVAAILAVATQAGDLLESAIKRHFKVKDTSSLIPGHGGLLDRLDGLLAAAPVAALLALGVGYGVPLWR